MTRRGLGRGLDSLLSSTEPAAESPVQPTGEVAVTAIRPNPYQPRRQFDATALDELAASIKAHGLLQPLVVAPDGDNFFLIAGERRWRASQLAGLTTVPVVVRVVEPRDMLALAVIENVQRADLNPIESAEAYHQLITDFGLTQAEVASVVGKSRVAVANTVRLLGLTPDVRSLVSTGRLSEGHGRALLGVAEPEAQVTLARRALVEEWTVRRTEDEVRTLGQVGAETSPAARPRASGAASTGHDANTAAAVQMLEGVLGTRVEIRRRGAGGELVVHFYSEEELASLYDRLVGSDERST